MPKFLNRFGGQMPARDFITAQLMISIRKDTRAEQHNWLWKWPAQGRRRAYTEFASRRICAVIPHLS